MVALERPLKLAHRMEVVSPKTTPEPVPRESLWTILQGLAQDPEGPLPFALIPTGEISEGFKGWFREKRLIRDLGELKELRPRVIKAIRQNEKKDDNESKTAYQEAVNTFERLQAIHSKKSGLVSELKERRENNHLVNAGFELAGGVCNHFVETAYARIATPDRTQVEQEREFRLYFEKLDHARLSELRQLTHQAKKRAYRDEALPVVHLIPIPANHRLNGHNGHLPWLTYSEGSYFQLFPPPAPETTDNGNKQADNEAAINTMLLDLLGALNQPTSIPHRVKLSPSLSSQTATVRSFVPYQTPPFRIEETDEHLEEPVTVFDYATQAKVQYESIVNEPRFNHQERTQAAQAYIRLAKQAIFNGDHDGKRTIFNAYSGYVRQALEDLDFSFGEIHAQITCWSRYLDTIENTHAGYDENYLTLLELQTLKPYIEAKRDAWKQDFEWLVDAAFWLGTLFSWTDPRSPIQSVLNLFRRRR